ncbi:hypothetical protein CY34DRAFT_222388 [Suillus luteus UH-Slu-Lm8-n1]|uniref:Uncharacterized protein n=1 Tax=Suillus luteus UH-Slu-Lm8-n1 TaxID=930992 RepID=A0A0D0AT63_9AGAM|nr:hypothetical protein CY34DRAFT_222388 [Suillus luteus UH-Slu-Lm8-n1]
MFSSMDFIEQSIPRTTMSSRTVQPTILLTLRLFERLFPQGCSNERRHNDPSSIDESRFPAPSRSHFGDLPLLCTPASPLQQTRVSRHEAWL